MMAVARHSFRSINLGAALLLSIHLVTASLELQNRATYTAFVGSLQRPDTSTQRYQNRLTKHNHGRTVDLPEDLLESEQLDLLSNLVQRRSDARWKGDYKEADFLRDQVDEIPIPEGFQVVIKDVSRKEGGGSSWEILPTARDDDILEGETVLQLAHSALGLTMAASEKGISADNKQKVRSLQSLVERAKDRLNRNNRVRNELGGRKAADAAFWFAIAGATDEALFQSLAGICTLELERYGTRDSCRAKDVLQIAERLAAAGIRDNPQLENVIGNCLASKSGSSEQRVGSPLDFRSERCLLMIWRFSTRQRKQRAFLNSAMRHWKKHETIESEMTTEASSYDQHYDWAQIFEDPNRPLVIDIGCGFGVSLLGLANIEEDTPLVENWSECNFVGVDLNGLAIGYARGLAQRWGLSHRLHFTRSTAEIFLQSVKASYPGPVKLCLIQFPTPFRLSAIVGGDGKQSETSGDWRGNSQLPSTANNGFMVTDALLRMTSEVLKNGNEDTSGKLLLQSNCEDVAVWMRHTACEHSCFKLASISIPIAGDSEQSDVHLKRIPKRTSDWIAMGGERADGEGWSKKPLLPRRGATETEVACMLNGTPVYRTLLVPINAEN